MIHADSVKQWEAETESWRHRVQMLNDQIEKLTRENQLMRNELQQLNRDWYKQQYIEIYKIAADRGAKLAIAEMDIRRLQALAIGAAQVKEDDQKTIEGLRAQAGRVPRLITALKRIDGLNDNPARFNSEIDKILREILD